MRRGLKILGLIPARGGSKGLPGKNIKPLGGVPLIGHTIAAARTSACFDRLWVSTDSPQIAAVAEKFGVSIPWLRPKKLAEDATSMTAVLLHLLKRLDRDEGYRPDAVLNLQPTSPFRTPATIRKAVDLFRRAQGDTVVSVTPARSHPYWCYRINGGGRLKPFMPRHGPHSPRQMLPEAFVLAGSIHLISTVSFLKNRSFFGPRDRALVVSPEEAVDIDTPADWAVAEALWNR